MSKSSKVIFAIFSILTIVILGSAYKVLQQRYRGDIVQKGIPAPDYLNKTTKEDAPPDSFTNQEPERKPDSNTEKNKELADDQYLIVTDKDCAKKCAPFKEDSDNFTYCQNFCGLSPMNKKVTSCDTVEDLEKDYCFKNMAINKKDFAACESIEDSGIKKTCKNRVTEEVLNGNEKTPEIIN